MVIKVRGKFMPYSPHSIKHSIKQKIVTGWKKVVFILTSATLDETVIVI